MNKQGFGKVISEFEFAALKKSRKAGFEAAYGCYADLVYSLALHLLVDKDCAADILQQVFEKLLLHSATVNGAATLGSWLKQTTINECMMYFRSHKRFFSLDDDDSGLQAELSEVLIEKESVGLVFRDDSQILDYLSRLPTLQRAVVYFYAVHGYKHREIAPSLGIDEANSRQLYHRAIKQLKAWLNHIHHEGGDTHQVDI